MATINAVNNTLTSATGTASFVGSDSPVLTGNVDAGGATTLKIPNGAAPTLNADGQIALDTTITDFNDLLTYRSASTDYVVVGILDADLTTNDGDIITYNATSDKFTMSAFSGGSDEIVQYVIGTSTSNDTSTSVSMADTSLSASITPTSTSNTILVRVFGYGKSEYTSGGGTTNRSGRFGIRRTSGTPVDLIIANTGRIERFDVSTELSTSYYNIMIAGKETAPATSSQTYVCQFATGSTSVTTSFLGASCPARMIIYELKA